MNANHEIFVKTWVPGGPGSPWVIETDLINDILRRHGCELRNDDNVGWCCSDKVYVCFSGPVDAVGEVMAAFYDEGVIRDEFGNGVIV